MGSGLNATQREGQSKSMTNAILAFFGVFFIGFVDNKTE